MSVALAAEKRGGERGERGRAVGEEGGGATVPARRAGVLEIDTVQMRVFRCIYASILDDIHALDMINL